MIQSAEQAREHFINTHTWANTHPRGERTDHGAGTRYWAHQQQLAIMGVPYANGEPRPLSAGPGNRNATRDEAIRHLNWLRNMAFLRTLAAHRAFNDTTDSSKEANQASNKEAK